MAFACMSLMLVAMRLGVCGMLENPRRSKMRWTPHWRRLRALGAKEVHLASCAYGSPHQKEFALMTVSMNCASLAEKCSRDHQHIPIQGKYTKPSAVYCHGLAVAIAKVFFAHFALMQNLSATTAINASGLEDVLTNEVAVGSSWQEGSSWTWRGSSHINVLEVAAAVRTLEAEALRGGDARFVNLVDSNVALCVLKRGRSSALALRHLAKRAAVISAAFGLYMNVRFCPTRYNPADHPTRDNHLPEALWTFLSSSSSSQLRWISSLSGLRRWTSNWLRLALLLCPSWIAFFSSTLSVRRYGQLLPSDPWLPELFDSTLGFPGEGPGHSRLVNNLFWLIIIGFYLAGATFSHGDAARRSARSGIVLPEGRRVTAATISVRSNLFSAFNGWLRSSGLSYDDIFQASPPDLDLINSVLTKYGRFLFAEGKPYYNFSETINAVSTRRPILRRSLQQAWDLCAMWSSYEPVEHHLAMPPQVLLAILSVCLVWGWTREAGIFAMCWGALLRPSDILNASRADIVFPQDVAGSTDSVLLKISEPKTRYRAARHQTGKLEQADLIATAWLGLGSLGKWEKLWPHSSSTLRTRLNKILIKLGLPITAKSGIKPLTLASFRPGGATFLIGQSESAEMVRRRGRWVSHKVMETYLQEVASSTFMTDIPSSSRSLILLAMEQFLPLLQAGLQLAEFKIPERAWCFLFQHNGLGVTQTEHAGRTGDKCQQNGKSYRPSTHKTKHAG